MFQYIDVDTVLLFCLCAGAGSFVGRYSNDRIKGLGQWRGFDEVLVPPTKYCEMEIVLSQVMGRETGTRREWLTVRVTE